MGEGVGWRDFWRSLDAGVKAYREEMAHTRGQLLALNNRAAMRERGLRVGFKGARMGLWVARISDAKGSRTRLVASNGAGLVQAVEDYLEKVLEVPRPPSMDNTQDSGRGETK